MSKQNTEVENIDEDSKVIKIVPSKLEHVLYKILYKYVGEHIPDHITPNQITLVGALGGLFGILCALLSKISILFLIGTIIGIICHFICDDLDGYVARKRNMTSQAGGYFDLLTDILHITYLIIALAFASIVSFQVGIFLVPVYALIIFTSMNSILYLKEFPFPRLGPVETHIFFIVICIGAMVFGRGFILYIKGFGLKLADIIFIIGGLLMYYEMIRLQIQLFRKLRVKDNER